MKVGLVIPVLNNFQQALDLIASAKTKSHELKIYIQQQYHYQKPLAAAWNTGISQAIRDNCGYIIVANDDVLFAPDSIDRAIMEFASLDSEYVLYGFKDAKKTFDNPLEILFSGSDTEWVLEEAELFSCFIVDSRFFDTCGKFVENFLPCFWEDNDMHYRIHLLGYKIYHSSTPYIHIGNQTTRFLSQSVVQNGAKYFVEKWGSLNRGQANWDKSFTPPLMELYTVPYNNLEYTPKEWRNYV